jgi:hypothetical protein
MNVKTQNLVDAAKEMLKQYGNCGAPIQQMAANGLSKAIKEASESRTEQEAEYFDAAKDAWERAGEIEIDDDALVSLSEDSEDVTGAYVQAWVWVDKIDLKLSE